MFGREFHSDTKEEKKENVSRVNEGRKAHRGELTFRYLRVIGNEKEVRASVEIDGDFDWNTFEVDTKVNRDSARPTFPIWFPES